CDDAAPAGWDRGRSCADCVGAHRTRDILELLLTEIAEVEVELARSILPHPGRDTDAARLGQAFEAGRDVDAVAEDVAVLDDDVALVDADAEGDAALRRYRGVAFGQLRLHSGGTSERVDDAGELGQQAVAGGLGDAAAM